MADNFDWSNAPAPTLRSGARPTQTDFDWSTAPAPVLRSTGRPLSGEEPMPLPPPDRPAPQWLRPEPADFSQSPFTRPAPLPTPSTPEEAATMAQGEPRREMISVGRTLPPEPFAGGTGAFDQVVTNPNIARQVARARGMRETTPPAPQYEDLPTVASLPGALDPTNLRMFFGVPFASTVEGRVNIIKQALPGATETRDRFGNPLIEYRGQRYHLDRPDRLNEQDLLYGAVTTIPSVVTGGPAALVTRALPKVAQVGGQFAAGVLSNLGRQTGAQVAGSGESYEAVPALLEGGLGAAVQAVVPRPSTPAYSQLDPAVRRYLESMRNRFSLGEPLSPDETLADRAIGAEIARQYGVTSQSGQNFLARLNDRLTQRALERDTRIATAVDDTFGPLDRNTRTFVRDMAVDKRDLSQQLTRVLSNAGPVDIAPVISRIDAATAALPENSAARPFYDRIRSLLQEGGQNISDPRKLQIALDEIDDLIKFGGNYTTVSGQTASLGPRPPRDFNSREIRTELSNALKQDPEYARVMQRYRDFYGEKEAFEAGTNLFSRDMLPETAEAWLNNPATADAFRLGARNAVRLQLGRNADELRNLSRVAGESGSIQNQVLRLLYGDEAIERLVNFAGRESTLRRTEDVLPAAIENQIAASIAEEGTRRSTRGLFDTSGAIPFITPTLAMLQRYTLEPLNRLPRRLSGFDRPRTAEGVADVLTAPGERGTEILRGLENARRAPPTSALTPTVGVLPASNIENEPRFAGGRVGRASGGRLMRRDHAAQAAALIRAADAAKKKHNKTTEGILDQPDEVVAKALSIANKAI